MKARQLKLKLELIKQNIEKVIKTATEIDSLENGSNSGQFGLTEIDNAKGKLRTDIANITTQLNDVRVD